MFDYHIFCQIVVQFVSFCCLIIITDWMARIRYGIPRFGQDIIRLKPSLTKWCCGLPHMFHEHILYILLWWTSLIIWKHIIIFLNYIVYLFEFIIFIMTYIYIYIYICRYLIWMHNHICHICCIILSYWRHRNPIQTFCFAFSRGSLQVFIRWNDTPEANRMWYWNLGSSAAAPATWSLPTLPKKLKNPVGSS